MFPIILFSSRACQIKMVYSGMSRRKCGEDAITVLKRLPFYAVFA